MRLIHIFWETYKASNIDIAHLYANLMAIRRLSFFSWSLCGTLLYGIIFSINATASKFGSTEEPNLALLLGGVQNCDLQIIHNGRHRSNLQHFELLPTTIFDFGIAPFFDKIFDVCKVRVFYCRITYVIFHSYDVDRNKPRNWEYAYPYNRITARYLAFRSWDRYKESPFTTTTRLNSNINTFHFIFSNDVNLINDAMKENENHHFEFLGIVKTNSEGKSQLCLGVKWFKILTQLESELTCVPVGEGGNVLQTFYKYRAALPEWKYIGILPPSTHLMQIVQQGNPFNRLATNFSMDLYILQGIFSNTNSSLFAYSNLIISENSVIKFQDKLFDTFTVDHAVQAGISGYSFVTCYTESSISFDFYFTPFQPEIWYALLATYILISAALSLWLFWKKIKGSFCPWLYVLGPLFEDGVPLPEKLEKNSIFRGVVGCWIIVCVLFSNCYNGLMITGLNSPLAATTVTTFRDLVCDYQEVKYNFEQYGKMNRTAKPNRLSAANFYLYWYTSYIIGLYGYEDGLKETNNPYYSVSTDCFSILSTPVDGTYPVPKFYLFLYYNVNIKFMYNGEHDIKTTKPLELGLNLFYPKQRLYPRSITSLSRTNVSEQRKEVEKEVVECGKTVFVAATGEFVGEVDFLSRTYPWIKFYISKDIFMPEPYGIIIKNPGMSKIPQRVNSLVESGIYSRLVKERNERQNFRRQRAGVYKPPKETMAMDGRISTLFMLCVGLAALAILVWGVECCSFNTKTFFKQFANFGQ